MANYKTFTIHNNLLYISGQLSKDIFNNYNIITGNIENNDGTQIKQGQYAATMCAIQILLVIKNTLVNKKPPILIDRVLLVPKLALFVNCTSTL